jgi:transposase, IS5 family
LTADSLLEEAVSQPRDDRQDDLFGPSLDQIINLRHPLVRLAAEIDWAFLAGRFSSVCRVGPGQPPLPTRLVAGLLILKHMHNLSDEALRDRWVENPYFQYFCGETVFQHEVPFDRSSLTRWRQRLGEEQIAALLQESLSVAPLGAVAGVVIDTLQHFRILHGRP